MTPLVSFLVKILCVLLEGKNALIEKEYHENLKKEGKRNRFELTIRKYR